MVEGKSPVETGCWGEGGAPWEGATWLDGDEGAGCGGDGYASSLAVVII